MERFEMKIEAELLARIDKAKGLAKRATWIKDVLARWVNDDPKDFYALLALVKVRAGDLGLWKTMQALDEAMKAVGWEVAEKIDPGPPIKRQSPDWWQEFGTAAGYAGLGDIPRSLGAKAEALRVHGWGPIEAADKLGVNVDPRKPEYRGVSGIDIVVRKPKRRASSGRPQRPRKER